MNYRPTDCRKFTHSCCIVLVLVLGDNWQGAVAHYASGSAALNEVGRQLTLEDVK